jgi:hypothetical protein
MMGRLGGFDAATISSADRWKDERKPGSSKDDR